MRSLLFDELQAPDMDKLREYCEKALVPSAMPGVYWLELAPDLLTATQAEHSPDCGPHRLALILEGDQMRLELLVRASNTLRCSCTGYVSKAQMEYVLGFVDRLLKDLDLKT
jgi:hypothetical protein